MAFGLMESNEVLRNVRIYLREYFPRICLQPFKEAKIILLLLRRDQLG